MSRSWMSVSGVPTSKSRVPAADLRRIVPLLVVLCIFYSQARAATHRVPDDFETLSAALDQIVSGDTIRVAPGEYYGPDNRRILVREKDFVLISDEGAAHTILDLGHDPGAYTMQLELQTRETVIDGFTFQHAHSASALVVRSSGPILRNCVFRENQGGSGAGLKVLGTSPVRIEDCLFENNVGGTGGAVFCDRLSLAEFVDCRFFHNQADEGGAIGCYDQLEIQLRDCAFAYNTASKGGAVSFFPNGPEIRASFEGCTIAGNTAEERGGGIWFDGRSRTYLTFDRTILSGNESLLGPDLYVRSGSVPPTFHCSAVDLEGISGIIEFDGENVTGDPLFCRGTGPPEHQFALDSASPCLPGNSPCGLQIGVYGQGCVGGQGGACCLEDGTCVIAGPGECEGTYQGDGAPCDAEPCRVGGACCTEGACLVATREHCDAIEGVFLGDEAPCPPGGCAEVACCLEGGSCQVVPPDECLALGGVCLRDETSCDPNPCLPRVLRVPAEYPTIAEALEAACASDTVLLAPGVYTGPGNRDLILDGEELVLRSEEGPESTVIDCRTLGRAFVVGGREESRVRIEGVTIRGGRVYLPDSHEVLMGGAVLVRSGDHVLSGCRIEDNHAADHGGAVACVDGNLRIEGSWLLGNVADRDVWAARGGAVYGLRSVVELVGTEIVGNTSDEGGGICAEQSEFTAINCVITGNWGTRGGGLHIDRSEFSFERCTIAGNGADRFGGGISSSRARGIDVQRSILWGNVAREVSDVLFSDSDVSNRFLCSVLYEPGIRANLSTQFEATVFQDPLFCAAVPGEEAPTRDGDYQVAENSVCLPADSPCSARIGALGAGCAPVPIGACCNGKDASCFLASSSECSRLGWYFAGEDISCDPSPCEEPGACCFNDGSCEPLIEELCLARDGRHHGAAAPCDPNPCPAPQGCCIPDRACTPLPPMVCEDAGGEVLDPDSECNPWTCTPNANGRLLVHGGEVGGTLPDFAACTEVVSSLPDTGTVIATVVAAFPPENSPRLRRAAFGIDYSAPAVRVVSWGTYSGTVTPGPSWPDPGSEIVVEWDETRRDHFEPLCWFELSVTNEPTEFVTTPSSSEEFGFWDDLDAQTPEEIACFGSLGVGSPGRACCWAVGACCAWDEWDCIVTSENHCFALDNYYPGDGSSCPCGFPAVHVGGVSLVERDFEVELSWHASGDVGFRGFQVLRSDHPDGRVQTLAGSAEDDVDSWRYLDDTVAPGRSYSYWIEATEIDGSTERYGPWTIGIPVISGPRLLAVHPNPTTGVAQLELFLPQRLDCSLTIYDASGRVTRDLDFAMLEAGRSSRTWDGRDNRGRPVRSGIYFLQFRAGTWKLGAKLVVMD